MYTPLPAKTSVPETLELSTLSPLILEPDSVVVVSLIRLLPETAVLANSSKSVTCDFRIVSDA